MAGYTLAQAQAQLDAWLAASTAVAASQSYSVGDRQLTRADAADIADQIKFWNGEVNRLTRAASGRRRTRYAVL
jgi:hypothetical protein